MARGEIVTARIERIAAGGAGIARPNGKSVFVELTAPGDMVRFRIEKEQKSWARADLVEVLDPSPARASPACPLYGACGGCSLQHLTYEAQIEAKTAILRDAFLRIGGFDPPQIRVRAGAPFEYRNRALFHRRAQVHSMEDFDCPSIGFMGRRSSQLVAINDCPVADAGIRKALQEKKIQWPDKTRFAVYSNGDTFLVEGGARSSAKSGAEYVAERGYVSILGRKLAMDAGLFFQSNAAMLELVIADLAEAAKAADKSLPLADIYCGVGNFAAFLADEFPAADLVEENKAALALARENVAGKCVHYFAGKDTSWIKSLRADKKSGWGFMVMDPPREGLSAPFAKWLAEYGSDVAAYVSCDPATLARDSRLLLAGGYALKELTFYDFYPQTAHIEALALFSRIVK
ncbi:MAG: TRAM domain-containing protein [Treponema sp.]|nr:TRAM domain-containing protein [Treponema sp.]